MPDSQWWRPTHSPMPYSDQRVNASSSTRVDHMGRI
ncbi:hypothetical protein LINPERPRIM_LOCUS18685 [Linum perenne]